MVLKQSAIAAIVAGSLGFGVASAVQAGDVDAQSSAAVERSQLSELRSIDRSLSRSTSRLQSIDASLAELGRRIGDSEFSGSGMRKQLGDISRAIGNPAPETMLIELREICQALTNRSPSC